MIQGLLLVALALQPSVSPTVPQPAPTLEERMAQSEHFAGEPRLALLVLWEQRFNFLEEITAQPPNSELQLRARVAGSMLKNLVRYGNLVIEKAVDNSGKSLINTEVQDDAYRSDMRQSPDKGSMVNNGLVVPGRLLASGRTATKLSEFEATLTVFSGEGDEAIVVVDPVASMNSTIEHPRLSELGIEIFVMPEGDDPEGTSFGRLSFRIVKGYEMIRDIEFVGEWLQPISSQRSRDTLDSDGTRILSFRPGRTAFDRSTQMILNVVPDIQKDVIRLNLSDIELP